VLMQCRRRDRNQEFLAFLRPIEANVQAHVDLPTTTKRTNMRRSELARSRERFRLHFTPTYSSWLNQLERGSR
jgi:putative transposase